MIKPAFSTVACPEWPLERVFEFAAAAGFLGVELRTFGDGSRSFACEPSLTAPEKIRAWADRGGVNVAQLGTSVALDEPIVPPLLGRAITDIHRPTRAGKRAIDLALTLECPLVRVFGFALRGGESRRFAVRRIVERLADVVDAADRTGTRVVIENGGDFSRASQLMEILDQIRTPLLGACFSLAPAVAAGDDPLLALNVLRERLLSVRVKDLRGGLPVPLGEGELPVRPLVDALVRDGFAGPVIFEWDRAWIPGLAGPEQVLPAAARWLFACAGGAPGHAAGPEADAAARARNVASPSAAGHA